MMFNCFKLNLLKLAVSSALIVTPISALADKPPCANSTSHGGRNSLQVPVNVSPSDINDGAAQAWKEIAFAAQTMHGAMVAQDSGMVSVTVMARVGFVTYPLGPFPIDFNGTQSIGQAILRHANADDNYPGLMEDMECDPRKNDGNDCCDECAGLSMLGPLDVYNTGFMIAGIKPLKRSEEFSLIKSNKRLAS